MPSAGFVIGTATRCDGSAGHGCSDARPPMNGAFGSVPPRLSHATIAFTRGSNCPMYETPSAPYEWPAMPTRLVSSSSHSGLKPGLLKPAFTRRSCLGACEVPLEQLLIGTYGFDGFEKKKLSASSVPSKKGRPSVWNGTPSCWSGDSPAVSDWPWPCGSQVSTT